MLDIPWEKLSETFNLEIEGVLSQGHRGVVVTGTDRITNEKLVFRVSDANHMSFHSILEFGQTFADAPDNVGLVPMRPPQVLDGDEHSFLCEIYDHVLFEDEKSMDLHEFVNSGLAHKSRDTALGYLHDVIGAIAKLHKTGFCHMDISLENVVLSKENAYVIDFESNIKWKHQYIVKQDICVPLKLLYCPIEHFRSSKTGYVEIEAYDVWAFGVMLFVTLFREFLFRTVRQRSPEDRLRLQIHELRYFNEHGLDRYIEKYRPRVAAKLIRHSDDEVLMLAWDLLRKIFVNATKMRLPSGTAIWKTGHRVRAEDILRHPLWNVVS